LCTSRSGTGHHYLESRRARDERGANAP
jgi:hypothetical protein